MNSTTIIICMLICGASVVLGKFRCPGEYNCSCSAGINGDYELLCPKLAFSPTFTIHYMPQDYLSIKCAYGTEELTQSEADYSVLKSISFQHVPVVFIQFCPFPNESFGTLFEQIGITDVRDLTFQSEQDLNSTVRSDHLSGLTELTKLDMSSNNLTNLPANFFSPVSATLKILLLRGNNLVLHNDTFNSLPEITVVHLGNNNLPNIPSELFTNMSKIKRLGLDNNRIQTLDDQLFRNLKDLETLDIKANSLQTLPSNIFSNLTSIRSINLSSNNFSTLPDNLFKNCENLDELKVTNNQNELFQHLPKYLLHGLTNLKELDMKFGNIKSIDSASFENLTQATNISLSRNQLNEIPEQLFQATSELQYLSLSFNNLSSLPNNIFQSLLKLQVLKLHANQLKTLSSSLFEGLTKLEELNIRENHLSSIHPHTFSFTTSLKIIDASNNSLDFSGGTDSFHSEYPSPFHNCLKLEKLNLKHNNIRQIYEDWTSSFVFLRKLNLAYNRISHLETQDLNFISDNLDVDLSNNQIKIINLKLVPFLLPHENKRTHIRSVQIHLDNNPIECDCLVQDLVKYVTGVIGSGPHRLFDLDVKNLACHEPPDLHGVSIESLKLDKLFCSVNRDCPKRCNCSTNKPSSNTVYVNCSSQNLTQLPETLPIIPKATTVLYLQNNLLTNLTDDTVPHAYEYVTELYLQNNNITDFGGMWLPGNLSVLQLNNNKISRMRSDLLGYLQNAIRNNTLMATLSGNPWLCDCKTLPFHQFLQKNFRSIRDFSNITCADRDVSLVNMPSDELCPLTVSIIVGSSAAIVILVMIIAVCTVLYYRNQRTVKVWLYAHHMCLWAITDEELDKDKLYDAFVSYSHKDEEFVTNELVPSLENGQPTYKLCLHYRDWLAGEWIPEQIVRSVEESRRTVVILSKDFIESVWGRLEFKTAHSQALQDKTNRVIVVVVGDLPPTEELDDDLRTYLNLNTYVKWGDPWFWEKLRYALPHPQDIINGRKVHSKERDDKLELINTEARNHLNKNSKPTTVV